MNPPWRELKDTEVRLLGLRGSGEQATSDYESLRTLLERIELEEGSELAICYHGAKALLAEFDGEHRLAADHRRKEIQMIGELYALAEKNPGDRAGLDGYRESDLAVRRRILREIEAALDRDPK